MPDSLSGQVRLRCVMLSGQPRRLLKVHWFRNGQHFASTAAPYLGTGNSASSSDSPSIDVDQLLLSNNTDLSGNFSCSCYNGINRFGPISFPKRFHIRKYKIALLD